MKPIRVFLSLAVLAGTALPQAVFAVDPPYQGQMQRLSEILGGLYMLAPLCGRTEIDWRAQMAELIALDQPDPDRRARLSGAFNAGYESYSRLYRNCTPSAELALERLLEEGETLAQDIHTQFAE